MAARLKDLVSKMIVLVRPKLEVFKTYARVELVPPTPGDLPCIKENISNIFWAAKCGEWKCLTVKDVAVNTLVALEVIFWFYFGECIGKRHFVGYNV